MGKTLWGHALVALVATTAAWAAWQKPTALSDDDKIVVIDGEPARLGEILWHEDEWDVSVGKAGEEARVTVSQRKKEKSAAGETSERTIIKTFPGTKQATKLFSQLAPLKAPRRLGNAEGDKLAQLGLDKPSGTLTLAFGDDRRELRIGGSTYGSGDAYAQLGDGSVYLLEASLLSPLKRGAATLLDKRALGIDTDEIARLRLSTPGGSRELVQRHSDNKEKAFFADAAVPDDKLETATVWVDRLTKLRMDDLVDTPPAGAPALSVEAVDGNGKRVTLELWAPDDKVALVKTSRFEKIVTVAKANAEALLKDVDALLKEAK